jgi:glutathionyl-hydroquinone reductase
MQEEAGRYAVFVGNACPWCHRVLLALILRGLLPAVRIVPMADDPERASRGAFRLVID